jgi:hypothetical protein
MLEMGSFATADAARPVTFGRKFTGGNLSLCPWRDDALDGVCIVLSGANMCRPGGGMARVFTGGFRCNSRMQAS